MGYNYSTAQVYPEIYLATLKYILHKQVYKQTLGIT